MAVPILDAEQRKYPLRRPHAWQPPVPLHVAGTCQPDGASSCQHRNADSTRKGSQPSSTGSDRGMTIRTIVAIVRLKTLRDLWSRPAGLLDFRILLEFAKVCRDGNTTSRPMQTSTMSAGRREALCRFVVRALLAGS